jgi:hypothetical protein
MILSGLNEDFAMQGDVCGIIGSYGGRRLGSLLKTLKLAKTKAPSSVG